MENPNFFDISKTKNLNKNLNQKMKFKFPSFQNYFLLKLEEF